MWAVWIYALHLRKRWHYCCVRTVSAGSAPRGENAGCLLPWLLHQPGEDTAVAAASVRREDIAVAAASVRREDTVVAAASAGDRKSVV